MRLRLRLGLCLSVVILSVTAVLSAPLALAKRAIASTITGTVAGANHYTLLAMDRTHVVRLIKLGRGGRFAFKATRDVTLQLLRPNNTFFGPIVIAHSGHRAYEALAGRRLSLGTIRLRDSYGSPSKRMSAKAVDPSVWATADRSGRPAGAGNLGLLPHRHKLRAMAADGSGAGSATLPAGGDPTHVGIVTAFNADVTGAGVPNAENAASAQASGNGLFTEIYMPLAMSVNDDASGVTPTAISDIVKNDLRLDFYMDGHAAGGASVSGITVDCGTLVYCATGTGTATVSGSGNTTGPVGGRWDGTLPANPNSPGVFSTQIAPNVGTDQIHPGDVFLVDHQTPAGHVIAPTTLTTYFLTVPAVASYDAGAGSGSISYPSAQNAVGTPSRPIVMSGGKIRLTVWRPQRAALPGETGSFYDVGHLHYGVPLQAGNREVGCGAQFYGSLSPTLGMSQRSQDQFYNGLFPLRDTADDAASNAGNTISFTLDLAGCLAANGVPTTGQIQLPISAVDEARQGGTDRSVQSISVCPPGCDPSQGQGPGGQLRDARSWRHG